MTSEVLAALLRANLVGAVAILVVLALRIPARRLFGPEIGYWLWAAPPLAAVATLLPARTVDGETRHAMAVAVADISAEGLMLWSLGVAAVIAGLVTAQLKFLAQARVGRAGPSVVGVISPRIVMPHDDGLFSAEERALIRAHEREHVARQDPRAGALAALLQALCWFNPLVHLGAHVMRLDQELACDAAVLRRRPRDRGLYARTLLKSQLSTQALPFGCYWPSPGAHPLEVRIGALKSPRRHDSLAGPLLVGGALIACALSAWSIQPPAPRHPAPILEMWAAAQKHRAMSVLLITAPPPDAAETARP